MSRARHNRRAAKVGCSEEVDVSTSETAVARWTDRSRLREGPYVELSPRRVRAYFGGEPVVDSGRALLVYESRRPPIYWFPTSDVRTDMLTRKEGAAATDSDTVRW